MTTSRNDTPKRPAPTYSTTSAIMQSFLITSGATVATSWLINPFNCASAAACRYNLTGKALFYKIYSGELNVHAKVRTPGLHNAQAGLVAHNCQEIIRAGLKGPGLGVYLPWLRAESYEYIKAHYSDQVAEKTYEHVATQIYSVSMSLARMAIMPVDTRRVIRQSGDPFIWRRSYKGAGLAGLREYGIWTTVNYNNMLFDPILQNNGIQPYGPLGIAIKAYPQATINIFVVYPLERIKNEMQFGKLPKESKPVDAARLIYQEHGYRGFFRGCLVKTPGAALQHAAALSVMAWGKRRAAKLQEQNQPATTSTRLEKK